MDIILNCGHIPPNPGPGSDNDLVDDSQSSNNTYNSFEMLYNHLSIFYFNVQSLFFLPKTNLLRG